MAALSLHTKEFGVAAGLQRSVDPEHLPLEASKGRGTPALVRMGRLPAGALGVDLSGNRGRHKLVFER
eukprot:3975403-Prymnesium_polylepis.1